MSNGLETVVFRIDTDETWCSEVEDFYDKKQASIHVPHEVDGMFWEEPKIECDIQMVMREYWSDMNMYCREISRAVRSGETPEWTSKETLSFLKDTIEGQHLLEKAAEVYGINVPLNMGTPSQYADEEKRINLSKGDKWQEIVAPDINLMAEVVERVDKPREKQVYTIRLVDHETGEECYYVGESIAVYDRLQTHISSGGSFSQSTSEMEVHEIVSIKPVSEVTESEQYEIVDEEVVEDVYGGR